MTHSIRMEAGDGGRLIVVTGEVDAGVTPLLEEALRSACEADPNGTVTVDLARADFIDSRTMGLLVAWTERQRAGGGRLEVAGANPNVLRVFRQIGLDGELNLVPAGTDKPHLS